MAYYAITLSHSSGKETDLVYLPEGATQTFKAGAVLRAVSGQARIADTADPWSAADIVLGVAAEPGKNLTTAGTDEMGYSMGAPPNQTSAKTIPAGAPYKSGYTGFWPANGTNIFRASLLSGQVFSNALVIPGTFYAVKYDSTSGFFYIDPTDTSGNNAVAEIVGPVDGDTSMVQFKWKATQRAY